MSFALLPVLQLAGPCGGSVAHDYMLCMLSHGVVRCLGNNQNYLPQNTIYHVAVAIAVLS